MDSDAPNEPSSETLALAAIETGKHLAKSVLNDMFKPTFDKRLFLTQKNKQELIDTELNEQKANYDYVIDVLDDSSLKSRIVSFIETNEVPKKYELSQYSELSTFAKLIAILFTQYYTVYCIEYLNSLNINNIQSEKREKIKFKGRPCDFGVLIKELVFHDFIEPPLPKRGPKENYKKQLASLCYGAFSVPNLDGTGETTEDNLYEEIKNPSLSNKETAFFKIVRKNVK